MILSISWLTSLVAVGAAAGGYFYARRILKRQGSPHFTNETLLQWEETPKASILMDPFGTTLIWIQALVLFSLGTILVYTTNQASKPFIPEMYISNEMNLLTQGARLGSVAILWFYFVGTLLFLLVRTFQRHRYAVSLYSDGIYYGSMFLNWHCFSHFHSEEQKPTVDLYSRFCPNLITIKLQPEAGALKSKLVVLLKNNLPAYLEEKHLNFIHKKWTLLLSIIFASLFTLAINLFLANHPSPWSWFLQLIVAYAFFLLCGKIIQLFYSYPSSKSYVRG